MQVKICGLCRPIDAAVAAEAGAHFAGIVLAANQRRTQTTAMAQRIFAEASGLKRVGVFRDDSLGTILHAAEQLALDVVQLHGSESLQLLEALRQDTACALWRSVHVADARAVLADVARWECLIDGLLFDGGAGSGRTFDWQALAAVRAALPANTTVIVAGGLHAGNVAAAVQMLQPHVVDVSSGVEQSLGEKDAARVRAFVQAARASAESKSF